MTGPVELSTDEARAIIDVERGGRLASLEIRGRQVLVGPPDRSDRSITWGSFLMAPWPGRLAEGRLRWAGETLQLQRNHGRHAIHGSVFDRGWRLDAVTLVACQLSVSLDRARWPFGGTVRQVLSLAPGRLSMSAEIAADAPMPAALGWHPWFRRSIGQGRDPEVRLQVLAAGILERRAMIPTGRVITPAGTADLSGGPRLGRRRLDDVYVGVRRPPVLSWPGLRLTFELGPALQAVTVYTPAQAICVEPQTAWPNALGLDWPEAERAGAAMVEPGRPLRAAWTLRWD
ncbi:MAG TPA: hypothetical protein VGI98_02775 [Candidatus Limnocylindrales bacterium]|jgi:aldose 1-epimerase